MISYLKLYRGNDVTYISNGNKLDITHNGNSCVEKLSLKYALVFPKVKNLVSISKITTDNSCTIDFPSIHFVIKDYNKRTTKKRHKQGQLHALDSSFQEVLSTIKRVSSFSLWHQCLRNPSEIIFSLKKKEKKERKVLMSLIGQLSLPFMLVANLEKVVYNTSTLIIILLIIFQKKKKSIVTLLFHANL